MSYSVVKGVVQTHWLIFGACHCLPCGLRGCVHISCGAADILQGWQVYCSCCIRKQLKRIVLSVQTLGHPWSLPWQRLRPGNWTCGNVVAQESLRVRLCKARQAELGASGEVLDWTPHTSGASDIAQNRGADVAHIAAGAITRTFNQNVQISLDFSASGPELSLGLPARLGLTQLCQILPSLKR